ncbi:MAG: prepilin peptidase [Vicinamibacteria bacterium]|jgi:leader peptidase (prepilin peptidase)/N-methyltransferase
MTSLLDPAVALPAAAVIGLCVGSFLNVVIHRLPKMMERGWAAQCAELAGREPEPQPRYDLVVPRSACPRCGRAIAPLENVPVVSWLALRGRCKGCGTRISVRYPIVELAAGVAALAAVWKFGASWTGLAACAFLWTLIALAFIDADTQLLPDDLTLPLLWGGLVANLFGLFVPLASAVIGAVAGYLALWTIYWLFKLIRGKEGMGYGDFKLLAALGAWLGWPMLPQIVLVSSVLGALGGIAAMALQGRDRAAPLPFGPWLAGAGAVALFFGQQINALYLR